MTQAAIAQRLALIAQECPATLHLPAIGAALIRAGKAGATDKTLAAAAGCSISAARHVLRVMEAGGFAMQWAGDVWRLDTVQILAREERAAIEALHAATAHERDAAATGIAKRKENTPSAQTRGKK